MDFINEEIQAYCDRHTSLQNSLLDKIDRETNLEVLKPRMLSGFFQGRALSMFSKMIKPNTILEIGTFTGFSALCMAEGLTKSGKLITLDINEELEDRVRAYFNQSDFSTQIEYKIGNALQLIPELNTTFDLVFIDADKINYLNYYHLVLEKVNSGGYIIADNVLWSGKVVGLQKKNDDEDTLALLDFNRQVQEDPRVENVLFPLRDGLMMIRKK